MQIRTVYDNGFYRVELVQTRDGQRTRIVCADSVSVLIYNRTRDAVLLVRQPRVCAIRADNPEGLLTEVVAGRFDVKLGPKALALKEAREEAGVNVLEDQVELLNSGEPMYLSAGIITERVYLAYLKVDDSMVEQNERVFGEACEGERISRVWVPVEELPSYVCEDVRVFTLIQWFLRNKVGK